MPAFPEDILYVKHHESSFINEPYPPLRETSDIGPGLPLYDRFQDTDMGLISSVHDVALEAITPLVLFDGCTLKTTPR